MATHHVRRRLFVQLDGQLPYYLNSDDFTLSNIMLYILY